MPADLGTIRYQSGEYILSIPKSWLDVLSSAGTVYDLVGSFLENPQTGFPEILRVYYDVNRFMHSLEPILNSSFRIWRQAKSINSPLQNRIAPYVIASGLYYSLLLDHLGELHRRVQLLS